MSALSIPEISLVVLIGPSGAGKSTFARRYFKPTEVLSSDVCRGMVCDDERDQSVSKEAFDVLHCIAANRLALGRLTVVDATNVTPEARRPLVRIAREHYAMPVAVVFDLPVSLCVERNRARSDRDFGPHVIVQHARHMRRSLRTLSREGFRRVFVLRSPEEIEAAAIDRTRMWTDRRDDRGPFDIIGDVHGCCDELERLLAQLGYTPQTDPAAPAPGPTWRQPEGRKAVFLGDLVDRGPRILDTLNLVRNMVAAGALCVPGNHDDKLLRALRGRNIRIAHGLAQSLAEINALPEASRRDIADFIDSLISHYVLDDGRLVVAHAGMKLEMQGRGAGGVREFALYGETSGETDEFGLPIRYQWAGDYRGSALVVYGHTPVPEPQWLNNTINIDTGCVFGGRLTALRYPERELVSVPAARVYCEPKRPLATPAQSMTTLSSQQEQDDLLDVADVSGKRVVTTRLMPHITIREQNAAAALETMSRFAANPKWLIYLPPTMSPAETSREPDLLEHPAEAFAYFRQEGVPRVICQAKHMGSRAVIVLCRDTDAARKRFGVVDGETGLCYTRTGRRFFDDPALEAELLVRIRAAADAAGLWVELNTDWMCLDCELMPWSAKAQALLEQQYAAVGAASRAALAEVVSVLDAASQGQTSSARFAPDAASAWR